jgi:regulator of nonsense transcripts 3
MLLQEFQKEIPKTSRKKASPPGVSVKIRYLPPGMKEYEVERILGDEWKAGNGNVIWSHFDRGKAGRP